MRGFASNSYSALYCYIGCGIQTHPFNPSLSLRSTVGGHTNMKKLTYILILFSLIFLNQKAFGTAQIPDFLIYKGDTLSIYANPLEIYFDNHLRPDSLFAELGYNSTACWRGYIAYWELKNDSLFLLEVQGDSTKIDLSLIFEDRDTKSKIFADWYSYSILNPYGKLLHYEHMGYGSIYEFEKEFTFKNGIHTETKIYDNSKSRKSKFTENPELLKKYIQDNIDYSNITSEPYEKARVFVQILSVTAEGKIDSVNVIRGWDNERDKEAVRVVKSIPERDILYRRGEQFDLIWTIPVIFGKEE